MTITIKIGIVIYVALIIQSTITAMFLLFKAKKTPKLYSLLGCHIAVILWLFFAIIENLSIGTRNFMIAVRFTLFPIMFIHALWLNFILYYTDVFTSRSKIHILLILPAIICYSPLLTNKYLGLIIRETIKDARVTRWGTVFYTNAVISYLYMIISIIVLLYRSFKTRHLFIQNILLSIAALLPSFLSILTGTKILLTPDFDIVPVSFSITLALLSMLIFKYKIINVFPAASYELFNHINSAALIVDREGNIDGYNTIFMDYFNDLYNPKKDGNISLFLETLYQYCIEKRSITKLKEDLSGKDEVIPEVTIQLEIPNSRIKQYKVSAAPIKASKRSKIGRLIIIKDVTEYRIEMLTEERNRLSDDLHDSLGNCINTISSNLEYALKNINNTAEIKDCIEISYEKSTSAFLHLRRIVEELKPIDIEDNGLLWALNSLFYKLRIKGINIEFSHYYVDDEQISRKKHGETIYYICQEAINNAIIHGRADQIMITLTQTECDIKLYITDDGLGCDQIVKSKGLNSMESRIKALGGTIEFGSPSEGGFNLRAAIPLDVTGNYKSEGMRV